MPKLVMLIMCDRLLIDAITNMVSFIGVIEQIGVDQAPKDIPFGGYLCIEIEREDDDKNDVKHRVQVGIKYYGLGNDFKVGESSFEFKGKARKVRIPIPLPVLKVLSFGMAEVYCQIFKDEEWHKYEMTHKFRVDRIMIQKASMKDIPNC